MQAPLSTGTQVAARVALRHKVPGSARAYSASGAPPFTRCAPHRIKGAMGVMGARTNLPGGKRQRSDQADAVFFTNALTTASSSLVTEVITPATTANSRPVTFVRLATI